MTIQLAWPLALLVASCSSVSRGAYDPLQNPSPSVAATPLSSRWDYGLTFAWNQRYVDSDWDPADDHRGVGVEISTLKRTDGAGGTGFEVGFHRAESNGISYAVGHGSTWRRWTDYTLGLRHELALGPGRVLVSGGVSYVRVDFNQLGHFGPFDRELDSWGGYVRVGYLQPLAQHLELLVGARYRAGEEGSSRSSDFNVDQAGLDLGLSWRF